MWGPPTKALLELLVLISVTIQQQYNGEFLELTTIIVPVINNYSPKWR